MYPKNGQDIIESVAGEISDYINKRPNAAETAEGIAKWWIPRQRIEESVEVVEKALEFLVIEKKIVKRNFGDQTLYSKAS